MGQLTSFADAAGDSDSDDDNDNNEDNGNDDYDDGMVGDDEDEVDVLICSGNHELYQAATAQHELCVTAHKYLNGSAFSPSSSPFSSSSSSSSSNSPPPSSSVLNGQGQERRRRERRHYLASNIDIFDAAAGAFVPQAPRVLKFMTRRQRVRIVAFGFLFDFTGGAILDARAARRGRCT